MNCPEMTARNVWYCRKPGHKTEIPNPYSWHKFINERC